MANKMLIDASHPEETRVVVLRGNRVEEFDFESANKKPLRGNIYLAKVTRVEPSLQAAFIEYGGNRHGFLAFSEIHPDYYQIPVADRQALLEEEQREHSQQEDEEPRQRRKSRRRGRNGRERRVRNGDTVSAEAALIESASELEGAPHPQLVPDSEHDVSPEGISSFDVNSADESAATATESISPADMLERGVAAVDETNASAPQAVDASTGPSEASQHGSAGDIDLSSESQSNMSSTPLPAQVQDNDVAPAPILPTAALDEDRVEARSADVDEARRSPADDSDESDDGVDEDDDEDEDDEDDEESEEDHVEQIGGDDVEEMPVRATRSRRQYKIQEVIRRRQVLLVQVVKEERGNKGAALTTYLSLAGRYSVLMPNTARGGGISRKITDSEDRRRMKEIAQDLDVPEGMGVILRTAGASRSKQEVRRDFEHLLRMWESVRELTLQSTAPTLVYEEGSLIKRTVRDLYSEEIDDIVVAGDAGYKEARDYMRMLMPSHARKIEHWRETQPLFARMGVEAQLDAMFSAQVTLKSGGYIVINQTEALVAIDVNSGRSTREHNIEDTALRTNLEAADEVARQLRLRDLAGLIVVDFIDMEEHKNNRSVERRLKEALKNDRARIQVGRISHFGLLEMSRQRMRTGVLEGSSVVCQHCNGAGTVRSTASLALHILRVIEDSLVRNAQFNLNVRTRSIVALYMLNQKRAHLRDIEERFGVTLTISADDSLQGSVYHVVERGDLASAPPSAPRLGLVQVDSLALPDIDDEEPELELEAEQESDEEDSEDDRGAEAQSENGRRRKRRRRKRGREREPNAVAGSSDETLAALVQAGGEISLENAVAGDGEVDEAEAEQEGDATLAEAQVESESSSGRRKRRTRRNGRRGERDKDDHAEQPGFRSPYGSWVRSPDASEPGYDATQEPIDLTALMAPAAGSPAAEASVESVMAAEPRPETPIATETTIATAPLEASPGAEPSTSSVMPVEPKTEAPAVNEAAVSPAEPTPEPPPARVEPLPAAPPPAQKKGGWWLRAK